MTIQEKAADYKAKGFNCAQSVLAACAPELGLSEETALAITGGFGGGLRAGEACGSLAAAVMALGMLKPCTQGDSAEQRADITRATTDCVRAFRAEIGNITCRDIIAAAGGKRRCPECVACAAGLVEKALAGQERQ